jgi:hypothetical protein
MDHPFCFIDPHYNFFDTELWDKIKGNFIKGQSSTAQPAATQQGTSQSQTPRAGQLQQAQQQVMPAPQVSKDDHIVTPSSIEGGVPLPLPLDGQSGGGALREEGVEV